MPELPDITVYVERIAERISGSTLERVRLASPFVLRTALPPISDAHGRRVDGVSRLGKRIVIALDGGLFLVVHLMISGRFRWLAANAPIPKKLGQAAFDFSSGTLLLTEAGSKKRASIHLTTSPQELGRGGLELATASREQFVAAMTRERHTLKRALTDPTILSGIGNAYSDEILHRARLSPLLQTPQLDAERWQRLWQAIRGVLDEWTDRLRRESGSDFPTQVTAFREGMAVHGRYGLPCPVCNNPVQRIRYADHETNYCARCQTDGKLLADHSLSLLLKKDWPRSLEELEELRPAVQRTADPRFSQKDPAAPGKRTARRRS